MTAQTMLEIDVPTVEMVECYDCAQRAELETAESDGWFLVNDEWYCESDFHDKFATCERCESFTEIDDAQLMTGGRYMELKHDQLWCQDCFYSHGVTCDGCDGNFHNYDMFGFNCCNFRACESCRENTGTEYCDQCDEESCSDCGLQCDCSSRSEYVHSYDHRPKPVWHRAQGEISNKAGAKPPNYYFGVELEISGPYDMATAVIGELYEGSEDDWYAKEDGSCPGVEFVSHPRTTKSWQEFDLQAFMNTIRNTGGDAGNDGLHIHCSRTAWRSSNHFRRTHELMTKGDRNRNFAEYIAGRPECSWASFARHPRKEVAKAGKRRGDSYVVPGGSRYGNFFARHEVLNVTNAATVEWRLGASTLKPSELLAAIEYYAACIEYTRTLDLASELWDGLTVHALAEYVADNMETYPHLAAAMVNYRVSELVGV